VAERPILFQGPLVAAVLRGEKTVTRRLYGRRFRCDAGDRLYVRETHAIVPATAYRASREEDGSQVPHRVSPDGLEWAVYREGWTRCKPGRWRPSIHMPRWASRISLYVVDARLEHLQELTHADALREGVQPDRPGWSAVPPFARLWDKINGHRDGASWAENPLVWRVEFYRETERQDA